MSSSKLHLDKRRRSYVRLMGEVRHALNQALAEEGIKRGVTCTSIARLLGKHKSFVSRKLNGTSNMTFETLADLAFALDRPVKVLLPERGDDSAANSNHPPPPVPETKTTATNDGDNRILATAI